MQSQAKTIVSKEQEFSEAFASGKIISPRAVNRRQLVNRGDKVIIKAVVEGIEVRMNGEAMGNGANGERISVKNLSSNRIINAVVTAQGIVSVILWATKALSNTAAKVSAKI